MSQDPKKPADKTQTPEGARPRKPYTTPKLVRYGDVRDLTLGAGTTQNEGAPMGQRKA